MFFFPYVWGRFCIFVFFSVNKSKLNIKSNHIRCFSLSFRILLAICSLYLQHKWSFAQRKISVCVFFSCARFVMCKSWFIFVRKKQPKNTRRRSKQLCTDTGKMASLQKLNGWMGIEKQKIYLSWLPIWSCKWSTEWPHKRNVQRANHFWWWFGSKTGGNN